MTRVTWAPSAAYLAMVAPLLIDSSSGCACTSSRRRDGSSVMGQPYEAWHASVPDAAFRNGRPRRTTAVGQAREIRRPGRQNLMLPIMPAMFVVRSLIVGAIVEEAR